MVDLVLLRHGRTEWNAARRIQGHADSQLDSLGHAQAEAVAPVLAALTPSVMWSSDSDRARSTAAYVASALGVTPTFDARLREYSLGHREGLYHHEFEADAPAEYAEFVRANWDAVPGAEKHAEVAGRMTAALTEVAAAVPEDGVALVVSHGAAIRTAVRGPARLALRGGADAARHGQLRLGRAPPSHPRRAVAAARLQPHRAARFQGPTRLLARIPRVVRGASTLGQHLGLWRSW